MEPKPSDYERDAVWQGRVRPREQLRVIEDRGPMVLVERFGLVLAGQHRRPFQLDRDAMLAVFEPTGRTRGPVTADELAGV